MTLMSAPPIALSHDRVFDGPAYVLMHDTPSHPPACPRANCLAGCVPYGGHGCNDVVVFQPCTPAAELESTSPCGSIAVAMSWRM